MYKLELDINDDVVSVINVLKSINDSGIELVIPEGSVLFDNILNLKLIDKEADKSGKSVHFQTTDAHGLALLKLYQDAESGVTNPFGVASIAGTEIDRKDYDIFEDAFDANTYVSSTSGRKLPKLPKVNLGGIAFFSKLGGTTRQKGKKKFIVPAVVGILLFFGLYQLLWRVPKAEINLTVNSQPLAKSIQIKVLATGSTNAGTRTLKGEIKETILTTTGKAEATEEKLVGEPATGEIKILNKTLVDVNLDEGTVVVSEDNLEFTLDDDVSIDPSTVNEEGTGEVYGEALVDVTASDIGEDYNVKKNENFEVDDYDPDELSAKANTDFEGGKSETVKVVSQEDQDGLATKLFDETKAKADEEMKKDVGSGRQLVSGSVVATVTSDAFNVEVGDELPADETEFELIQSVSLKGLSYSQNDLDKLLDELLAEFVPEGYELSDQGRETKVEVLGNAETTVLSETEADLQVTLKAFVVTKVNEEEIKNRLVNKSVNEAQDILDSIENINNYSINISPKIPLFNKLPKKAENITVKITKE